MTRQEIEELAKFLWPDEVVEFAVEVANAVLAELDEKLHKHGHLSLGDIEDAKIK